jgi:ferredoxin-thioredoxin reductase catalytic subunit
MKLNPNKEYVNRIKQAISEKDGYCPCMIIRDKDTKCPCKPMRENQECICGLYVKEENKNRKDL